MNPSKKDYYFVTNHTTNFRYFVDNTTRTPLRYLYYPQKYELMTVDQIKKYERNLIVKLLWWGLRNKNKMNAYDYQACRSKIVDIGIIMLGTLFLAKSLRKLLFRQEIMGLEKLMMLRNMDTKFWKASIAYATSFGFAYHYTRYILNETYLTDLAMEYSPNFTKQNELKMKEIQPVLDKFHKSQFPWLSDNKQI